MCVSGWVVKMLKMWGCKKAFSFQIYVHNVILSDFQYNLFISRGKKKQNKNLKRKGTPKIGIGFDHVIFLLSGEEASRISKNFGWTYLIIATVSNATVSAIVWVSSVAVVSAVSTTIASIIRTPIRWISSISSVLTAEIICNNKISRESAQSVTNVAEEKNYSNEYNCTNPHFDICHIQVRQIRCLVFE